MLNVAEKGVASVACDSHATLLYVISFFFFVEILPFLALALCFFVFACEVTCLLLHLRFREGTWKAALTKNNKESREKNTISLKTNKTQMQNTHVFAYVFCYCLV